MVTIKKTGDKRLSKEYAVIENGITSLTSKEQLERKIGKMRTVNKTRYNLYIKALKEMNDEGFFKKLINKIWLLIKK